MYTVNNVKNVSKHSPSKWILSTEEEFDIDVEYRYGFLIIRVNDDILHKKRITSDITDSTMTWESFLDYYKEYLPKEMINFKLIQKSIKDEKSKKTR